MGPLFYGIVCNKLAFSDTKYSEENSGQTNKSQLHNQCLRISEKVFTLIIFSTSFTVLKRGAHKALEILL